MRSNRLHRAAAVVAVTLVTAALAACAPSAPESVEAPATPGGSSGLAPNQGDQAVWMAKFESCMDAAGFPVAAKGQRIKSDDIDPDAFVAAQRKCSDAAGPSPVKEDPQRDEKMRDVYLKFSQCMRDRGFDFADPIFKTASDGTIVSVQQPNHADYPVTDWDACNDVVGFKAP